MRISGRFCWVEFRDTVGAQRALNIDGETSGEWGIRVSPSQILLQLYALWVDVLHCDGYVLRASSYM